MTRCRAAAAMRQYRMTLQPIYLAISRIICTFAPHMGENRSAQRDACQSKNDIAQMLALLHDLQGIDFVHQLRLITERHEFSPLKDDPLVFTVGGERLRVGASAGMGADDYGPLLDAARKAVEHGYRVFVLPNPKGFRTADFIFERKGVYKMFDLKTISGSNSVDNRLSESVHQTNRVLLHMKTDYNPGALARSIKRYFELNPYAREVLVFKGMKQISITRKSLDDNDFFRTFIRRYTK